MSYRIAVVSTNSSIATQSFDYQASHAHLHGWLACAVLAKKLAGTGIEVCHIHQPLQSVDTSVRLDPQMIILHKSLGIDPMVLCQQSLGDMALASRFKQWNGAEQDFYFANSPYGKSLNQLEFQHFLARVHSDYDSTSLLDLNRYNANSYLASQQKMLCPQTMASVQQEILCDADSYSDAIQQAATKLGVKSCCDKIEEANLKANGNIESLLLASGERFTANAFIDCSGKNSFLSSAMGLVDIDSYSSGLSVIRFTEQNNSFVGTSSEETSYGWYQTVANRAQTEHRCYFNSVEFDEAQVLAKLSVADRSKIEYRRESYQPWFSERFWSQNYLLVGQSAASLQFPIDMRLNTIVWDLERWLEFCPFSLETADLANRYNVKTLDCYQQLLDFLLLPFRFSQQPFLQQLAMHFGSENMEYQIALFRQTAILPVLENRMVSLDNWIAMLLGMNCWPLHCDVLIENYSLEQIKAMLRDLAQQLANSCMSAVEHKKFMQQELNKMP